MLGSLRRLFKKNGGMTMVAGFLFKEYEVNQEGMVTGYQVILENEQVATLEYRSQNQMWIGAIIKDIKIMTRCDKSVMRVVGWIIHEIERHHS